MEGALEQEVKSPQDIEDGIISIKTVAWNPFSVLPKEIYVIIFNMLGSPSDKRNFMNAHIKWVHLLKSKRTTFLFEGVFQEMSKIVDKEGCDLTHKDPYNFRLVCHDWDNAVQNHFQLHPTHFMLDTCDWNDPRLRSKWAGKPFIWTEPVELEKDLEKFSAAHPPSKNPFLSRSIIIFPFIDGSNSNNNFKRYKKLISALLNRYGQHIWHCVFNLENKLNMRAILQIKKWLLLMPELKTLKVKCVDKDELSIPFKLRLECLYRSAIAQPEMEKLAVLKSSYLPPLAFNYLFGNVKGLEKIQIKFPGAGSDYFYKDFEIAIKRENLREAYFHLKRLQDLQYLGRTKPFPNVNKLVIKLQFEQDEESERPYIEWPKWRMMWLILEAKFPALEDLDLRLPKAISVKDKVEAVKQSLECRLNLGKLNKLWITLPNLVSIDFILECKALEELKVVMHNTKFKSNDWMALGRREKLKFNMDLSTMWESNVWEEFRKLKVLDIGTWREGGWTQYHHYRRAGEERMYFISRCPSRRPRELY